MADEQEKDVQAELPLEQEMTDEEKRAALLEGQDVGGDEGEGVTDTADDATPVEDSAAEPQEPSDGVTTEPEASTEPTQEQPQQFDAVAYARELGLEDVEDPNQAAAAFLVGYQQAQEQAAALKAELERQRAIAEAYKSTGATPQTEPDAQQDPAKPEPWWNPPKFDPASIERYRTVTVDADGNQVTDWAPNTPDEIKRAAVEYQNYLEDWADKLVRRPQEVLPQIIRQEVESLLEERLTSREQTQQNQQFIQQVFQQNEGWLYEHDPISGEVVRDPVSGSPKLTQEGNMFLECLDYVENSGVTNPQAQWQMAVALFDQRNLAAQQQPQPQSVQQQAEPEQTLEQQQEQVLRQRARQRKPKPDSPGTQVRSEEDGVSEDQTVSPGRQLLASLQQDGVI